MTVRSGKETGVRDERGGQGRRGGAGTDLDARARRSVDQRRNFEVDRGTVYG
jgi:hypothetical protein